MEKKITKHIGANLVTPAQYAALRGDVTRMTVDRNIKKGNLPIVHVGMNQETYIDWKKYKAFEFNTNMQRF